MLEDRRARDHAAEAERVERVVHALGPARAAGRSPRRTRSQNASNDEPAEARRQHLEVEVEPHAAAGERRRGACPPRAASGRASRKASAARGASDTRPMSSAHSPVPSMRALRARARRPGPSGGSRRRCSRRGSKRKTPCRDALLDGGGLGEAEDRRRAPRARTPVSKSITTSPDETTISPRRHGYLKKSPSCASRTTGGRRALDGERQRREELALRRVAGEPPALAARVDAAGCAARAKKAAGSDAAPRVSTQPVRGPTACCRRCRPARRAGRGRPRRRARAGRGRARGGARGARGRPRPAAPRRR